MNMDWECTLPLAEGSVGSVGDILTWNGVYYAMVDENTTGQWHVESFDEQGTRLGSRAESVVRSCWYAQNADMVLAEGTGTARLYTLPTFTEIDTGLRAAALSRWCFSKPVTNDREPYFALVESGAPVLSALARTGRLLWRQELPLLDRADGLLLTHRFIIVYGLSRTTGMTSLLIFSMGGELLKAVTPDSRYEHTLFHALSGSGVSTGDHVILLGEDEHERPRLAKIHIRTHATEAVTLPRGGTPSGKVHLLPDGFLALLTSELLLLDPNLNPVARFPQESFPGLCIGALAPTPEGDFLLGGARMAPCFTPWIGRFPRRGFAPYPEKEMRP